MSTIDALKDFKNAINEAEIRFVTSQLQESFVVEDEDAEAWESLESYEKGEAFDLNNLETWRKLSRKLATWNPMAKGIIANFENYVIGKGFTIRILPPAFAIDSNSSDLVEALADDKFTIIQGKKITTNVRKPGRTRDFKVNNFEKEITDEQQELIQKALAYWKLFTKRNKWFLKIREIARRTYRDGESFLWLKPDNQIATLLIRFIDPARVKDLANNDSYGIRTDEDDVEEVLGYHVVNASGTDSNFIDADDMIHTKVTDSDVKRGLPEILSVMKRLNQYDTWIHDRIILNKLRAAIALIRKWNGASPKDIGSFADAKASRTDLDKTYGGDTRDMRRTQMHPGTIIDTNGKVTYEYLAPDLQAGDVRHDGRAITLSIASGVNQPEYMVTGDSSNANYSSTIVSQAPSVKSFESWQQYFAEVISQVFTKLMIYLVSIGKMPDEILAYDIDAIPTSIIFKDKLKEAQANEILFLNKIISPQMWAGRENIDFDYAMYQWQEYFKNYGDFVEDISIQDVGKDDPLSTNQIDNPNSISSKKEPLTKIEEAAQKLKENK